MVAEALRFSSLQEKAQMLEALYLAFPAKIIQQFLEINRLYLGPEVFDELMRPNGVWLSVATESAIN